MTQTSAESSGFSFLLHRSRFREVSDAPQTDGIANRYALERIHDASLH